ncbi:MAG: chloride channel protein [Thermoplasmata archaeon]
MSDEPKPSRPEHLGVDQLGDFTTSDRRLVYLSVLAIVVGVAGALVAAALYDLIGFFTNLFYFGRFSITAIPPANSWGILSIAVPVGGGLVVGLMARYGSEQIRGHGIPEAIESILINGSRIKPKVTVLKPLSSAIAIGSGGPFGAEGPIIMTGGAIGSLYAQFIHLSAGERKTLLVAGAAAGMSAIFNTPLAAVLLAVELLLFEWKPRSLVPVGVASGVAALLSWYIVPAHGFGPLFPIPASGFPTGWILAGAALAGVAAGALATALTYSVYFFEDGFRRLPIHWMWWPAIGGVVVGIGGLIAVGALGVGYGQICGLIACTNPAMLVGNPVVQVTIAYVVTLLIVKWVIWSVALGSGTSGGVLAPLLIMGGALGTLFAFVMPVGNSQLWTLVCMAAVLAGTMRAPFTGVVFALELTHDVNAIVPLFIAAIVADGFTVLSMQRSILTEKVARRGVHVAREYSVDALEQVPVRSIMHSEVLSVRADTSVEDSVRQLSRKDGEPSALTVAGPPDGPGHFIARADLLKYLDAGGDRLATIGSVAPVMAAVAYEDEPVRVAIDRLARTNDSALPIVDAKSPTRVIGFVTREGPFEARILWNDLDHKRERSLSVSLQSYRDRYRVRNQR